MKMKYVKPAIIVEHFALNQSIATQCGAAHWDSLGGGPNHWGKNECAWVLPNGEVYWTQNEKCGGGYVVDYDFDLEVACYNNPNGGANIFGS